MKIRQETLQDYPTVFQVIVEAFEKEELSDHTEQFLVERLRRSSAFIPELSLLAEFEGEIVGHILLTKIKIKNDVEEFPSLALAPVSILPKFQKRGIGGTLIREAHAIAKELGYKSIALVGHEKYYPKFGYVQADRLGINFPFEAPKENCMVIELIENGLQGVGGIVVYPEAFEG